MTHEDREVFLRLVREALGDPEPPRAPEPEFEPMVWYARQEKRPEPVVFFQHVRGDDMLG